MDLGEITRCYSLRYERTSKHPPVRLWRAITDPTEVTSWVAYPARIELRVGGEYFVDFSRTAEGSLAGVIVRLRGARTGASSRARTGNAWARCWAEPRLARSWRGVRECGHTVDEGAPR